VKRFVNVITCAAALLTVGCGYDIKTSSEYDRRGSFSAYRTFYILNGDSSGSPGTDQQAIGHGFAASAASDDPTSIAHAAEQAVAAMFSDFPPASQGLAVQP
jgi:hypothetical protein